MGQEENWKELCNDTIEQMKVYVDPFITPIWKYKNPDESDIKLHGSGSYFEH